MQDEPVFVRRIRQTADDLFGLFEFLFAHNPHIDRMRQFLNNLSQATLFLALSDRIGFDDQQVKIAVLAGYTARSGTVQNYSPNPVTGRMADCLADSLANL